MIREMSVVGSFYPQDKVEIKKYFTHFSKIHKENFKPLNLQSRVVIVPHAGYIYSGYTANIAYEILQKSGIKKFIVIGPSHRVAFNGVSLCNFINYKTPFGDLSGDINMAKELKDNFLLKCFNNAHHEHSTEVQFPFIKYYIPDAKIVELVYGKTDPSNISQIIDFALSKEDYGVIISTDLSHFYNLEDAKKLDNICLEAIDKLDIDLLHNGCEACGLLGVKALIISAKKLLLKPHLLDYRTSADASGDKNRVVGYMSGCF